MSAPNDSTDARAQEGTAPVTSFIPATVALAQADDAQSVSSVRSDGGASVASSVASSVRSGIPKLRSAGKITRSVGTGATPAATAGPLSPGSSTLDGYEESYRRVTDELNRYKLSDVQEADEYEEDYSFRSFYSNYRNRYSSLTSTGSSMDALWDTFPRRLSEAGLSRYSDNSTVLTEDTDSFIIGQHVWVGGTKPGQIAFIGETQFAPGEWAGIVLDQPIGKNDGSVAGLRYFQCEPKRGVFSRLTRLTRTPLPGVDLPGGPGGDARSVASSVYGGSSNIGYSQRKLTELRRTPPGNGTSSIAGSRASNLRSPSALSTSNNSLATPLAGQELKLGDRVIVSSSQGSKVGTLRYIGFTAFANGEWCGVELDNPVGKNDGSVQGKRYFDCASNYGVFAPISKVSRSPSKVKPGNCAIHSSPSVAGSTPIRRSGSRESLASMSSSIISSASQMRKVKLGVNSLMSPKTGAAVTLAQKSATTPPRSNGSTPIASRLALQHVLEEKQRHIEQLLKERDLERAETIRAGNQADAAELKLTAKEQEFKKYQEECSILLQELKNDRTELLAQLDDEKRKNEDIMFKFEEAAILKGDVETTNDSYLSRIKDLETELDGERRRAVSIEEEASKDSLQLQEQLTVTLANTDLFKDQLQEAREQCAQLKEQLDTVITKNALLSGEESTTLDHLEELKSQLEEAKLSNEALINESNKAVSDFNRELSRQKSEHEMTKFTLNKEIEDLKLKLEADNTASTEHAEMIATLKTDLESTSCALGEKHKSYEVLKYEQANNEAALQKEIDKLKMELSSKIHDSESYSEDSAKFQAQIESLNANKISLERDLCELKDQLLHVNNQLESKTEENNKRESEFNCIKSTLETQLTSKDSEKENQLKEKDELLQRLREDLAKITILSNKIREESTITQNTLNAKSTELESQVCAKDEEIKVLHAQHYKIAEEHSAMLADKDAQHKNQLIQLDEKMSALSKELHEKNDVITDLQLKLSCIQNDVSSKTNDNEAITKDLEAYKEKVETNENENARLNESLNAAMLKLGDIERMLSTEQEKLQVVTKHKNKLESDIESLLSSSGDNSAKLEELNLANREKESQIELLTDSFNKKLQEHDHACQALKLSLESATKDNQKLICKLDEVGHAKADAESKCKEQMDISKLEKAESSKIFNIKIKELENNLIENKQSYENDIAVLKGAADKNDQQQLNEIQALNEKVHNLHESESNLKQQLVSVVANKSTETQELFEKITKLTEDLLKAKESQSEQAAQLADLQLRGTVAVSKNSDLMEQCRLQQDELQAITDKFQTEIKQHIESENTLNLQLEAFKADQKTIQNDLSNKIIELENVLSDKEKRVTELEEMYQRRETDFDCEAQRIEKERQNQTKLIDDLSSQLKVTQTELQQKSADLSDNISKLQTNNESNKKLELEYTSRVAALIAQSESNQTESMKIITELQAELDTLKKDCNSNVHVVTAKDKENVVLLSKLHEMTQQLDRVQSEKAQISALAVQESKKSEAEYKTQMVAFQAKIAQLESKVSDTERFQKEYESQRDNYAQIVELLRLTEKQKQTLVKQLEETVNTKAASVNCADLVNIVKKIQVNNTDVRRIMELQQLVDEQSKILKETEAIAKTRECEIAELRSKLATATTEISNRSAIPKPVNNNVKNVLNDNNNDASYKKLLEEKIFAENQVEFLNSIIIDMKKKTEEQQARIEILESGYGADMADEIALLGVVDRRIAPRKYCDICEEFDLHETEDCPIQAADDMPPPPPPAADGKRKLPEPRPYCEFCEEFGHDASNCPLDETF